MKPVNFFELIFVDYMALIANTEEVLHKKGKIYQEELKKKKKLIK